MKPNQDNVRAARHDVRDARKELSRQRKIRAGLADLRRVRRRIRRLETTKPKNWEVRVAKVRVTEERVLARLKKLGWKPRQRRESMDRARPTPGPAPMRPPGAELEPAEEPEPPEEEPPEEEPGDGGNDATEGNWLFGDDAGLHVIEKLRNVLPGAQWSTPMAVGTARLQTRKGERAMVLAIKPGLFVVQIVPDAAAQQIASQQKVEVGVVPLLLVPAIAKLLRERTATVPAPAAGQPGAPGWVAPTPPAPTDVGCDCRRRRRGGR